MLVPVSNKSAGKKDDIFGYFLFFPYEQPKLVINNIEVLRNAILTYGDSSVCAPMYHDSLIWRITALGVNEKSLPVILVTSDRYGSSLYRWRIQNLYNSVTIFQKKKKKGINKYRFRIFYRGRYW